MATTQENKPPTQGTRQWTFTTPRRRCGSILLPSLNAGVPEPTGGSQVRSSRSWVRSKVKVKAWVQHSVDSSLPFHINLASHSWVMAFSTFGLVNQRSRSNDHNIAQLQVQTIPQNFKWHYKSIQQFQRYGFRKVWPKCCLIWQVFGPWASPYGANNYDAAQLQV